MAHAVGDVVNGSRPKFRYFTKWVGFRCVAVLLGGRKSLVSVWSWLVADRSAMPLGSQCNIVREELCWQNSRKHRSGFAVRLSSLSLHF